MEDVNIISGDLITAIFTGMAAVISAIGGILWGGRNLKKKLAEQESDLRTTIANELRAKITNDPLHVQQQGPFVSIGECKQYRCAMEKRLDGALASVEKLPAMIEDLDKKAEKRSVDLHRRLDPIAERCAANTEAIEFLKGKK